MPYIVEDICPSLHGETLEHSEHSVADVIEARDAVVGAAPVAPALGDLGLALVPAEHALGVARSYRVLVS